MSRFLARALRAESRFAARLHYYFTSSTPVVGLHASPLHCCAWPGQCTVDSMRILLAGYSHAKMESRQIEAQLGYNHINGRNNASPLALDAP